MSGVSQSSVGSSCSVTGPSTAREVLPYDGPAVCFGAPVVPDPVQKKGRPKGGWRQAPNGGEEGFIASRVLKRPREGEHNTTFKPASDWDGALWSKRKLFEKYRSHVLPRQCAFVRFVVINSAVCWVHVQSYTDKTMDDKDEALSFVNDVTVIPPRCIFNIVNPPTDMCCVRPSVSRVYLCKFSDTSPRMYRTFDELYFSDDHGLRQDLMLLEPPVLLGCNNDAVDWDHLLYGIVQRSLGIPKCMRWSDSFHSKWNFSFEMLAAHGACIATDIPPFASGLRPDMADHFDASFVEMRTACKYITKRECHAAHLYGFARQANEFIAPSDMVKCYQSGTFWKLSTDDWLNDMELDAYSPLDGLPANEDARLSLRCPSLFLFLRRTFNLVKGYAIFKPLSDCGIVRYPPLPLDGGSLNFAHFGGYLKTLPPHARSSLFAFVRPDALFQDAGDECELVPSTEAQPGFARFEDGLVVWFDASRKPSAHVTPDGGVLVAGCPYDLEGRRCRALYTGATHPSGLCYPLRAHKLFFNTFAFMYALLEDAEEWLANDAALRRATSCTRAFFFRVPDEDPPSPLWGRIEAKLNDFCAKN